MSMAEALSTDWLGLAGRVCVVTGAGGGIGRAVATSRDWKRPAPNSKAIAM
jgi:hypothetical protein